MIKFNIIFFLSLLFFLFVGKLSFAQTPCCAHIEGKTIPYLRIQHIFFEDTFTIVRMAFQNKEVNEKPIRLFPPNMRETMFLRTKDKEFRMIKAEGISYFPMNTIVKPNTTLVFDIFFPVLTEDIVSFDIIENQIEPHNAFNFYNIRLSRESSTWLSHRFLKKEDFVTYFKNKIDPEEGFYRGEFSFEKQGDFFLKYTEEFGVVREDGVLRFYDFDGRPLLMQIDDSSKKVILEDKNLNLRLTNSQSGNQVRFFSKKMKKKKWKKLPVKLPKGKGYVVYWVKLSKIDSEIEGQ